MGWNGTTRRKPTHSPRELGQFGSRAGIGSRVNRYRMVDSLVFSFESVAGIMGALCLPTSRLRSTMRQEPSERELVVAPLM